MKKQRVWQLAIVAIVCSGLLLWGVVALILSLVGSEQADLQTYFSEQWQEYRLVEHQTEQNTVRIEGTAQITYEQAAKYGSDAYDEAMLDSYVQTTRIIALDLQTECGLTGVHVQLNQLSSDGQLMFTVASDGTIWACWE